MKKINIYTKIGRKRRYETCTTQSSTLEHAKNRFCRMHDLDSKKVKVEFDKNLGDEQQ